MNPLKYISYKSIEIKKKKIATIKIIANIYL